MNFILLITFGIIAFLIGVVSLFMLTKSFVAGVIGVVITIGFIYLTNLAKKGFEKDKKLINKKEELKENENKLPNNKYLDARIKSPKKHNSNKINDGTIETSHQTINPKIPVDFTVLDFETTGLDLYKDEIIEIGAIKVRDLKIVDEYTTLCNPLKKINNSNIHGITNEDVTNYKHFKFYLDDLLSFIGNDYIMAYNAPFDVGFLNSYMDKNIENKMIDLLSIARKSENRKSYKLVSIKNTLNIKNTSHRALDDTKTTLEYYKHLIKTNKLKPYTPERYNRNLDKIKQIKSNKINRKLIKNTTFDLEKVDSNNPFFKKKVCFTGTLDSISRQDACLNVLKMGGEIKNNVTLDLDYLVVGYYENMTTKEKKANEYNERDTVDIKIITEKDFLNLISK